MSYVTHAGPTTTSFDWPSTTEMRHFARIVGLGLTWLGGGVAFATTVYIAVALPGLLD